MSRKSRRNRPAEGPAPAAALAAANPGDNAGRIAAIVIALVTLAIVAALSVKLMSGGPKAPSRPDPIRTIALESAQAPSLGPADARVHIVEFLDPACETCATFYPHVKKIMAENPGRIRLSVRHVYFHKGADEAVRLLEGARAQGKYFEALEALLAGQDRWVDNHRVVPERLAAVLEGLGLDMQRLGADMGSTEVRQRMKGDMDDARILVVTKTPEYFVNGRQMPEFGLDPLRALVQDELRRAYP